MLEALDVLDSVRHAHAHTELSETREEIAEVLAANDPGRRAVIRSPRLSRRSGGSLGFPTGAYFPKLGKSGLKPDFTPIDLIAHPFVFDAKGSEQRLGAHEKQIRTSSRSGRSTSGCSSTFARCRGEALADREVFARFRGTFSYRQMGVAEQIDHVRRQSRGRPASRRSVWTSARASSAAGTPRPLGSRARRPRSISSRNSRTARRPDDLRSVLLPRDLKAFEKRMGERAKLVAGLLAEGRRMVEEAERLVCALYDLPELALELGLEERDLTPSPHGAQGVEGSFETWSASEPIWGRVLSGRTSGRELWGREFRSSTPLLLA